MIPDNVKLYADEIYLARRVIGTWEEAHPMFREGVVQVVAAILGAEHEVVQNAILDTEEYR